MHGPTVTNLESSVKVMCHKTKINFCGKSWGEVLRERCVDVGVRGGGVGDSRNGNGRWMRNGRSVEFSTGVIRFSNPGSIVPFLRKLDEGRGSPGGYQRLG